MRTFGVFSRRGEHRAYSSGFNAVHRRLRNRVGVLPDIVFETGAILAHLVGPDGASILKMDDLARRTDCAERK